MGCYLRGVPSIPNRHHIPLGNMVDALQRKICLSMDKSGNAPWKQFKSKAESTHAKLKLYLKDTMSSLETSVSKIDKMLTNQFGDINVSFEKSINILRHKHANDNIYSQLICRVTLEAMALIDKQLEAASDASPYLADMCACPIKTTHGLPCRHDIADYRNRGVPIPRERINVHWRTLSMRAKDFNTEKYDRTSKVVALLETMDPNMQEHMINRFFDIADPSQSTVRPPSYNTEHKGRPVGKVEQSSRRIPSFWEKSSSESATGVRTTQPTRAQHPFSSNPDPYIHHFPPAIHQYISNTVNVRDDGHYGFRTRAAQVFGSEDNWKQVRIDLY